MWKMCGVRGSPESYNGVSGLSLMHAMIVYTRASRSWTVTETVVKMQLK